MRESAGGIGRRVEALQKIARGWLCFLFGVHLKVLRIGVPVALSSTRILKSLLYELSPLDPTAISIAIAAVSVMTIAAAWLPARRATKIDPIQALRTE
jgi:ABC-type antimicrobial peptide transport system permease subunit